MSEAAESRPTEATRLWCSVPAWWIPVWVAMGDSIGAMDPLEEAVLAMVRVGRSKAAEIETSLCLDSSLVASALSSLEAGQVIEDKEATWRVRAEVERQSPLAERPGWVAWDSRAGRPLFQVWLGREPRREALRAPEGWELLGEDADAGPRPTYKNEVEVTALAAVDDLLLLESSGGQLKGFGGDQVRRVRWNPGRAPFPGAIYVPVELRPAAGPVVWRPSLVPMSRVQTELDPGGWEGLEGRVTEGVRHQLQARRNTVDLMKVPFLMQRTGFATLEDLREAAARTARLNLASSWDAPGWSSVQSLVIESEASTTIGRALGYDWRWMLQPWASVLDLTVRRLSEAFKLAVTPENVRRVTGMAAPDRASAIGRHAPRFGSALGLVTRHLSDKESLKEIGKALEAGTIGNRLAFLAFAMVFGEGHARPLADLVARYPNLFEEFDRANQARNKIVHLGDGEQVDVVAFRFRVGWLARVAMEVPIGGGQAAR